MDDQIQLSRFNIARSDEFSGYFEAYGQDIGVQVERFYREYWRLIMLSGDILYDAREDGNRTIETVANVHAIDHYYADDSLYGWVQSGLSLRTAPGFKADKIALLPFDKNPELINQSIKSPDGAYKCGSSLFPLPPQMTFGCHHPSLN